MTVVAASSVGFSAAVMAKKRVRLKRPPRRLGQWRYPTLPDRARPRRRPFRMMARPRRLHASEAADDIRPRLARARPAHAPARQGLPRDRRADRPQGAGASAAPAARPRG